MASPELEQPVVVFLTVSVPVYVPEPGLDGVVIDIGVAGKEVKDTALKPAVVAPAPQAILY